MASDSDAETVVTVSYGKACDSPGYTPTTPGVDSDGSVTADIEFASPSPDQEAESVLYAPTPEPENSQEHEQDQTESQELEQFLDRLEDDAFIAAFNDAFQDHQEAAETDISLPVCTCPVGPCGNDSTPLQSNRDPQAHGSRPVAATAGIQQYIRHVHYHRHFGPYRCPTCHEELRPAARNFGSIPFTDRYEDDDVDDDYDDEDDDDDDADDDADEDADDDGVPDSDSGDPSPPPRSKPRKRGRTLENRLCPQEAETLAYALQETLLNDSKTCAKWRRIHFDKIDYDDYEDDADDQVD